MVCDESTSYWAVHLFTHSRLLAFLERGYLKQVVSLKKTCIGIDKDMDIDTLFFGPIFGNISQVRLFGHTYLCKTTSNKARKKVVLTVNILGNYNESVDRIFIY